MPVKFKFNKCLILRSMGANDKKEDTLAELYSTIPRSTLIEVYKKYWFDYEMFGYDFNQVLQLAGYKSLTEFEKSEILLKFPEVHRKHNSGPPRPIFGRQGLHSGAHISGVPPLPPPPS